MLKLNNIGVGGVRSEKKEISLKEIRKKCIL